jgi:hypothetical protein
MTGLRLTTPICLISHACPYSDWLADGLEGRGEQVNHIYGGVITSISPRTMPSVKEGKRDIACYETPYSSRDIHKENLLTGPGSSQDGPVSSPGSPRYPMERSQRRCHP